MDLQKELEKLVQIHNDAVNKQKQYSELILKSLGGIEVLQNIIKEKDEEEVSDK